MSVCLSVRSSRVWDNLSRCLVLPSKAPYLGKQRLGGRGEGSRGGGIGGGGGGGGGGEGDHTYPELYTVVAVLVLFNTKNML